MNIEALFLPLHFCLFIPSFVCLSVSLFFISCLFFLKINMCLIWFFLISYENPTECWPVILLTIEYVCFWACAVFGVCIQFPPRYCYVELIGIKYTKSNISYHKVDDTLYFFVGVCFDFCFCFCFCICFCSLICLFVSFF